MEKQPYDGTPVELEIEGHEQGELNYHYLLLSEAGLIVAIDTATFGDDQDDCQPIRLTWKGHEFLDAARNDRTWKKAMKVIGRQGGVAFEVLIKYLMQELEQKVLRASSTGP